MNLMNWFLRKINKCSAKVAANELEVFLLSLKGATDKELALILVLTTHFRFLMKENYKDFDGVVSFNGDGERQNILQGEISKSIRALQAQKSFSMAAAGMPWLHTLRASTYIELRYGVKKVWREIMRGAIYADNVYFELCNSMDFCFEIIDCEFIPDGFEE